MVETIVMSIALSLLVIFIVRTHYNGYKKGYKAGFEQGRVRINEYVLKVNNALGERVAELQNDINKRGE